MMQADGTIKAIHLHWDGYPGHAGMILGGWYKTPERVEQLIALGNLSSIAPKLEPDPTQEHSKANPQKDVTVAYHRDYGERLVPPTIFPNKLDYERNGRARLWASYLYLFEDGRWFVKGIDKIDEWVELIVEIGKSN